MVDPLRAEPLSNGRTLIVRSVADSDTGAIGDLYNSLSLDDLRYRFFSVFRPDERFLSRWLTASERGGANLLAEIRDGRDTSIVAEAGFARLPNGDGEFAITVVPRWRGWLGAYLVDALVERARALDLVNLEADILTDNRRMMALVAARGWVALDHPDWFTVRLAIGVRHAVPGWPPFDDRRRLLVETCGGRWSGEQEAKRAGFQVMTCPAPHTRCRDCPAMTGARCPLAASADVIVVGRNPDQGGEELAAAHGRLHPGPPVVFDRDRDEHARILEVVTEGAAS